MAFGTYKEVIDAELEGSSFFSCWRKLPTQTTGSGIWFDLSMSPGNPVPNYYASTALISVALRQSTHGGIPHGGNVSPKTKHLKVFGAMTQTTTAVPLPMMLMDYLMFYPFIDMSTLETQELVNSTTLPRYTDGVGVQMMAVEVAGQLGIGNPQFYVTYTNSEGIEGRRTPNIACNTQIVNGTVINSNTNLLNGGSLFLPLQDGDRGVRKIESITFLTEDIGLIALVLVRPIENFQIRTVDAFAERVPLVDFSKMPTIEDDAYLNLAVLPRGTLAAAQINGYIQTIWL